MLDIRFVRENPDAVKENIRKKFQDAKLPLVDEAIALDANISKIDARKAVDAMIRVTVQSLREGERLTLTGLGTFSVQQKAARIGRNPRTGAAVKIPPRKAVKFRPTIELE